MADETLRLVPTNDLSGNTVPYPIEFAGRENGARGLRIRLGRHAFSGPVALKIAEDRAAVEPRLRREVEVAGFLSNRGGELLAKSLASAFTDHSAMILVNLRGEPLADLARDQQKWPPPEIIRRKMITDLLRALEILRLSGIVHGDVGPRTLYWDGDTLQLADFGSAALRGTYPDGRPAHHGDDVAAAGRVVYQVFTGQLPPTDPRALRAELEQVQDAGLTGLLLRRDLVARSDLDYVFADDPAGRPSARELLDRLDTRPHGVQRDELLRREAKVRADFRDLRRRQAQFRVAYVPWAEKQREADERAAARHRRSAGRPFIVEAQPGNTIREATWASSTRPSKSSVVISIVAVATMIAVVIGLLI